MINETVVNDRMNEAVERAERRRLIRVARAGSMRRHSLRDVVGHGLIAIGERLVDQPPAPDPTSLDKAA